MLHPNLPGRDSLYEQLVLQFEYHLLHRKLPIGHEEILVEFGGEDRRDQVYTWCVFG